MDGIEPVAASERIAGWALDRGRVDDPDLDDALGPRPLQQPRHLRSGDPELFGDGVLRLAQLVVEAAGADELLEIAHVSAQMY